ncbi:MAG: tetratricopeptide repeat protein [Treponema sp.]|nr:tetratricopeptide repeat protein [Candidatus Treponema caballi]
MESFLPLIIAGIVVLFAVIFILLVASAKKSGGTSKGGKPKNSQALIRDCTKKLAQDPHNPAGLIPLSDYYYQEQIWDKAYPLYDTMLNVSVAHPEINLQEASLRQGICAIKLNRYDDALRGLTQAFKLEGDSFEINFYLGQAYYQVKKYDKAIPLLKKAFLINKEVPETYKFLGLSMYNFHDFRGSLPFLKKALDINPEDKELLFCLAEAMNEMGNVDKALKIYMHLRADPEFGARSSLACGTIHTNQRQLDKAIQDFEIGMRHENVPLDVLTNIRYRLAHCYLQESDMAKALTILKEIQVSSPGYKDVPALIARYQELNQNSNLRVYLVSGTSDFINLCRRLVAVYFPQAYVKVVDITSTTECVEVQTEIETPKWEDNVLFRFYRTTGSTGELFVRDFHARIRDMKDGRGICITAGTFTEEARKFIEGRPIDLVDKAGLLKMLQKLDH